MYLREIFIQFFKLLKMRWFGFLLLSFKFLFNWKVFFFFLTFHQVQFTCFFSLCFWWHSKNPLPNQKLYPWFLLTVLQLLVTFHCSSIWVHFLIWYEIIASHICMWIFSCHRNIVEKTVFLHWILLTSLPQIS